jgi:hypothetical protein
MAPALLASVSVRLGQGRFSNTHGATDSLPAGTAMAKGTARMIGIQFENNGLSNADLRECRTAEEDAQHNESVSAAGRDSKARGATFAFLIAIGALKGGSCACGSPRFWPLDGN